MPTFYDEEQAQFDAETLRDGEAKPAMEDPIPTAKQIDVPAPGLEPPVFTSFLPDPVIPDPVTPDPPAAPVAPPVAAPPVYGKSVFGPAKDYVPDPEPPK